PGGYGLLICLIDKKFRKRPNTGRFWIPCAVLIAFVLFSYHNNIKGTYSEAVMDFTEAISYSLKGHNIPKILTIVLISMIVGVSVFVIGIALESVWVLLLILPVLLCYGLFVQGYTISVIKSVMDESDVMPAFDAGRDIGRGAVVLIASIVYMIPVIAFF